MKKICLLSLNLAGGGAQKVLLNQARVFSLNGFTVDIIILKSKVEHKLEENLYKVHYLSDTRYLSKNKLVNYYLFYKKLKAKMIDLQAEEKFDLVLSHSYDTDQLLKPMKNINKYFYVHGTMSYYIKKMMFLKKILYNFVYNDENVITVSDITREDFVNCCKIKTKTIRTIYNMFDFENIRKLSNEPVDIDDDYILHVGSFVKLKRHDLLLKAYEKSNIKHKLVLLGKIDSNNTYINELKILIQDLGLEKKVILRGFEENPYPFIKKSKLLVLSSDTEGLPTVLIESLILNTMIVSTNCISGPSEIMTDEFSKFLSPVGDVEKLSVNIKKAIESPIKIKEKFLNKFNSTEVYKKFLLLYHKKEK